MRKVPPLLLLLLAGCSGDAPTGQVVARVDGSEVTRRELMAELQAGQESDVAQQAAALDRVIDRKLLVAAAKDALVDRTPTVQIAQRHAAEAVLAQAYLAQVDAGVNVPDDGSVARYRADHPWRYGQRFGALVAHDGQDAPVAVDSAALSADDAAQFGRANKDMVLTVGSVRYRLVDRWPTASPDAAQQAQARADLMAERQVARRQEVLKKLRARAVILRQSATPE